MAFPILQFGTSRFLQAHVDLFVARGFVEGPGQRRIAVVQTTSSADSARRVAFFDSAQPYEVNVRGLVAGAKVDTWEEVDSIGRGVDANRDWETTEKLFIEARWIVSNTGDRGYELDASDAPDKGVPVGFPAKLTKLLHARFRAGRPGPTLFPCELIEANGDRLRAVVVEVAKAWGLSADFLHWLNKECLWINSLVDRIVSAPIEPAGAVAEPYALWAVEDRPGLIMPCRHESVVVTNDLKRYERLKLFILNLGHTYLAELWSRRGAVKGVTVRELLGDWTILDELNDLYDKEVLPVFEGVGLGAAAYDYRGSVLERFRNPFLDHYLSDIFSNHAAKKQRRFGGLIGLGEQAGLTIAQPRLRAALAG
ncbi:MAG: mannitol dehydrogenase family protein [Bradyrhizobium sp.]|nr:MAG: mannitol dehydrogenase family protein [Bradyrhizobium sp.]